MRWLQSTTQSKSAIGKMLFFLAVPRAVPACCWPLLSWMLALTIQWHASLRRTPSPRNAPSGWRLSQRYSEENDLEPVTLLRATLEVGLPLLLARQTYVLTVISVAHSEARPTHPRLAVAQHRRCKRPSLHTRRLAYCCLGGVVEARLWLAPSRRSR